MRTHPVPMSANPMGTPSSATFPPMKAVNRYDMQTCIYQNALDR